MNKQKCFTYEEIKAVIRRKSDLYVTFPYVQEVLKELELEFRRLK